MCEHAFVGPLMFASTLSTGYEFTVTVTVFEEVHPSVFVAVAVYVVVTAGLAVTVVPVVELKPVAGDHVIIFKADTAFNVVLLPV